MPIEIKTKRLLLQEISWKDLENIHQLHSIPEVDEFNCMGLPKDFEETRKMIKPSIEAQSKETRDSYTWKIMDMESGVFMGMAGMFPSNDKFKLGEIYYKFAPAFWGRGYATEVAKALIFFGFEELKLHKVEAGVAVGNEKSIRVLEKCGMTREGLRRKVLPIRGEWIDNYHYAIVEDDPRPA